VRKPRVPGRAAVAAAALTAACALAACASPAGRGVPGSGNDPSPAITHPAAAAAAALHFKFAGGCTPAAAAYDVTDAGTAAWAVPLPAPASSAGGEEPQSSQPVAIDGLAVFVYGNVISARRLTDGSLAWQRTYPGSAGTSLGEVGGLWAWHGALIALIAPIYLGERPVPMQVQALTPATGAVRWSASLGTGDLYNDQVITSGGVLAMVTEAGGAGGQGKLMAFDLNARKLLWTRPYGKEELTDGPVAAGPVLVMGAQGTFTAYDARTGTVRWARSRLPGSVQALAGPGNSVLLSDLLPQLGPAEHPVPASQLFGVAAVNAVTGAVLWRVKTVGGADETAVIGNGMIVVGTSGPGRLTLLRADGQPAWSVPENVANGMTWVDTGTDLIYVASDSSAPGVSTLVDRRLSTGAVRWSTALGTQGTYAMVVRPAGANLIVAEAPGPPSTSDVALAVDPATGHVSATAPLAAPVEIPLTVAGGDTLMEITSAPCPVPSGPVSTSSDLP
jgi:outer membrane protein assembly factor BamB